MVEVIAQCKLTKDEIEKIRKYAIEIDDCLFGEDMCFELFEGKKYHLHLAIKKNSAYLIKEDI